MMANPTDYEWMVYLEDKSKYFAKEVAKRNPNVKSLKEFQSVMNSREFRTNYALPKGAYDALMNPGASKIYDKILKEYSKITGTKEIQTTFRDYFESSKVQTKYLTIPKYGTLKKDYVRAAPMKWTPKMNEWLMRPENRTETNNNALAQRFNKEFELNVTAEAVRTKKYRLRGTKDKGKYKFKE